MNKLDLQTPDFVAENAARLAELFPNCVTESRDPKTGGVKRSIDFDLLRQELAYDLVEGPQERYRLDWPGKREALALANAHIRKTLRPCKDESVDFDTTQNLYIEGDNLDALKLLQETYLGKVKMIYIDPPYNTGNDFIYDDNFSISRDDYESRSGDVDEEGNAMFDEEKWKQNLSSHGRFHSEWLSMIYPRLKLARNLLSEEGIIFVSIDDFEGPSLKLLLDEIFGSLNYISTFVWRRSGAGGLRGSFPITNHEYVISYAKNSASAQNNKWYAPYSESADDAFDQQDANGFYKTQALYLTSLKWTPNQAYGIELPDGTIAFPPNGIGSWRFIKETYKEWLDSGKILFKQTKTSPLLTSKGDRASYNIYTKQYRDDKGSNPSTWLTDDITGQTRSSKAAINDLFGAKAIFDYAKPEKLTQFIIKMISLPDDAIILDFFSGSSTTAHAVMQLNAEDSGKRRHIMVQIPEPCDEKSEAFKAGYKTIAEIGKERIRRAGQKILAEWQAKQATTAQDLLLETQAPSATPPDIGFRVLKIDSSNMADVYYQPDELTQDGLMLQVDNLKPGRKPEDLLFQVLLDWGVDLTLKISKEIFKVKKDEGRSMNYEVFFVDDNALAACFDTGLDEDFVKELAQRQPLRAVFRDSGYASDAVKINFEQIFKALSPHTELKTL